MGQAHSQEEVDEMVSMASHDGKNVMFDDFKKIGRGKIPSFAGMRQPEANNRSKQDIIQNIQQSHLFNIDPEEMSDIKEELGLSREKYQAERACNQKDS
jgi:hypothetical protein